MKKMIPYGKQYLDQKDILSVKQSLKEPLITTGKSVKKFENSLSKFLKVKHAITCNSGTAALHLAFMGAGIKKNDVVIMPVVNFISAYNMCKSLGAKIFVADVDSQTGQMTPKFLLECIKKNKIKKIKAILTMYMGGFPENITEFYNIKKLFKCLLIEDACHALGSQYMYKNKLLKIGSCSHADISTFSLHPLKPITTGEGGIVTTKNETIASNIRELRSHGIIRDNKFHWKYNIRTPGYNYRLSDINCSLGLSQLKKINSFLIKRKKIYDYYKENLEGFSNSISFPKYNINNKSSYHLVLINVNFNNTKKNKDKFMSYLYKNNIISQYHYIPINKFKVFNSKNLKLKSSNIYYMTTLSIPIYQKLNRNVQNFIIKKIQKFFDNK
jgi:dTDP-4-amino-4,6-dideoxygalactose transaminase